MRCRVASQVLTCSSGSLTVTFAPVVAIFIGEQLELKYRHFVPNRKF